MRKIMLGAALVSVAAVAAVPAFGAAVAKTSTKPTINILGGTSFVPNRYIQDQQRFAKDVYVLKSGAQIKISDKGTGEPHTVSVVNKSDLPKTMPAFGKCFAGGVCGQLTQAHGFPDGEGPATTPLLNKGATGLDAKGDSIVTAPEGPGRNATIKLSAKKGKSLYLLCVIHPWMQAKISVK